MHHRWRIAAVALVGTLIATFFVAGMVDAANPRCCPGKHPYVTLYDHERSQIEALLVTGDGQAFAALAQDPLLARPEVIEAKGEYAYRAQRPVWGYLAWIGSLGRPDLAGWALVVLAVLSCGLACAAAAALLIDRGATPWWALLVIVPAQETLSTLTPEFLAFALLAWGVLLWQRRRPGAACAVLSLAALTRESMLVGVVALALWQVWMHRADLAGALRSALPLAIPCLVYAAWAGVLRARLGAWPVGTAETRVTAPLGGLLDTMGHGLPGGTALGVLFAVGLCTSALILARRDALTWVSIGFLVFATTFSREVWIHAGFMRTLIPLYACAGIAMLGGLHRRRVARATSPIARTREPELVRAG